jgi:hypothetical protein
MDEIPQRKGSKYDNVDMRIGVCEAARSPRPDRALLELQSPQPEGKTLSAHNQAADEADRKAYGSDRITEEAAERALILIFRSQS